MRGSFERGRDEPSYGLELDPEDVSEIAGAGFTAVRIPVRFSAWALESEPYTIDPSLLDQVDAVLDAAAANDLAAIVDVHHYDEIFEDPAAHSARLAGIWHEIATHVQDRPTSDVFYELLNEPHNNLNDDEWNQIAADTLATIRTIDPVRPIIIGPTNWNDDQALPGLVLPDDDNIIVTFHYYAPFEFTHQGAEWVTGADAWLGTGWSSADGAGQLINDEFAAVAEWASERNVPVLLGEFGVVAAADEADRVNWVRWVREAAENEGFAWAYWSWAGDYFGIQNDQTNEWDTDLLEALIPNG